MGAPTAVVARIDEARRVRLTILPRLQDDASVDAVIDECVATLVIALMAMRS